MAGLKIFGLSFLYGLSGALVPGPLLFFTVALAARDGARVGPLVILGHGLLELAIVIAIYLGLSRYLKRGYVLKSVVILGSVVLIIMGISLVKGAGQMSLNGAFGETRKLAISNPILGGALVSLANPYFLIWWASVGVTTFAQLNILGGSGWGFLYTGHISADLVWYSLIAFAAARGRTFASGRAYSIFVALCGFFLIGFALYFLGWIIWDRIRKSTKISEEEVK